MALNAMLDSHNTHTTLRAAQTLSSDPDLCKMNIYKYSVRNSKYFDSLVQCLHSSLTEATEGKTAGSFWIRNGNLTKTKKPVFQNFPVTSSEAHKQLGILPSPTFSLADL